MTQYRSIVLSLLAVFLLSALCTPSDAQCADAANCVACIAATPAADDTDNCEWCAAANSGDTAASGVGQCVDAGSCSASTSPAISAFASFGGLVQPPKSIPAGDLCTSTANVAVTTKAAASCTECLTGNTTGSWCSVTVGAATSSLCLVSGACNSTLLVGRVIPVTNAYLGISSAQECCAGHTTCQQCAPAAGCSWCAPIKGTTDGLNAGYCESGDTCGVNASWTAAGFTMAKIAATAGQCSATPAPKKAHWTKKGCAVCTASDTNGYWCPFTKDNLTGGICLTTNECTAAALTIGSGVTYATSVSESAKCSCDSLTNCSACASVDTCAWCSPTKDSAGISVGTCVEKTTKDSKDVSCKDTTIGNFKDLGFSVASITSTDSDRCTSAVPPSFTSETACKKCVEKDAAHWCPVVETKNKKKGGLCVKNAADCKAALLISAKDFEVQKSVKKGECPKESNAFSMLNGSAIGLLSAMVISGFVM